MEKVHQGPLDLRSLIPRSVGADGARAAGRAAFASPARLAD
jgi:hypothetical protein